MKRKVIQIAESTQLISLPRKWCVEHGIKKGDELDVEEQGNKIIIQSQHGSQIEKKTVLLSEKNGVSRSLYSAYIQGVDELELQFSTPDIFSIVQQDTARLLGFEIVSHTQDSCIIKSVAPVLDTEFDNILRRILILLVEMAKDTYESAKNQTLEAIPEIIERERTNNKLVAFCLRILNKRGYRDHKRVTTLYALLCEIEYIADEVREIASFVKQAKKKPSYKVMLVFRSIVAGIQLFYELVYKMDIKKFSELKKLLNQEVDLNIKELLPKTKELDTLLLHHLSNISEQIYHATLFSGVYDQSV